MVGSVGQGTAIPILGLAIRLVHAEPGGRGRNQPDRVRNLRDVHTARVNHNTAQCARLVAPAGWETDTANL